MPEQDGPKALTFRCPAELEGLIPKPVPASLGLPDWLKAMPQQAPDGYAVLFTHPVNRFDLPFTTLTGLVDCDRYHDNWIQFPAHWHDANFSGVLPRGTPIAQCVPVKREKWAMRTASFTGDETQRAHDLTTAISREQGIYRRQFRA